MAQIGEKGLFGRVLPRLQREFPCGLEGKWLKSGSHSLSSN